MKKLSHIDRKNAPAMVDVSDKPVTKRTATAQAIVALPDDVLAAIKDGDLVSAKGPVFHTAIIAGTQAVKRTSELIPFCHGLPVENCKIDIVIEGKKLVITCDVATTAKTGIEMEALTGASIAALTVYDMVKALSHDIVIENISLLAKSGGKSGFDRRRA
jgi:cyclic pyranopterin phosphate synthase